MLNNCAHLGDEIVNGWPVTLEMCSPAENPELMFAAMNGSCMYSGSMGDSAGKASGWCLPEIVYP